MIGISTGPMRRRRRGASVAIDPDAQAYSAAMTTHLTSGRLALVSALVATLKLGGAWTPLDWLALLAQETAQGGRVNLRNPAKVMVAVNSPIFTTDRGFAGDGASAYLDFGERFDAAGNSFARDSASIGAWTNLQVDTTARAILGTVGVSEDISMSESAVGNETVRLNDGAFSVARTSASKLGHRTMVRRDATVKLAFFNGAPSSTFSVASTAVPGAAGSAFHRNASYSTGRIAAIYSGGALSNAQVAALHSALSTYLTAIGAQ